MTELQILREHTDYLSVIAVHKDTIFSASGDENIYLHRFPTGKQHYDMLRTQERNSVAVLYQGPESGQSSCNTNTSDQSYLKTVQGSAAGSYFFMLCRNLLQDPNSLCYAGICCRILTLYVMQEYAAGS